MIFAERKTEREIWEEARLPKYDGVSADKLLEAMDKEEEYLTLEIPLMIDNLIASRKALECTDNQQALQDRKEKLIELRKKYDEMRKEYIKNIDELNEQGIPFSAVEELRELDHPVRRPKFFDYKIFEQDHRGKMDYSEIMEMMKRYGL